LIKDINTTETSNESLNIMNDELTITVKKFKNIFDNPKLINNLLDLSDDLNLVSTSNSNQFNDININSHIDPNLLEVIRKLEIKTESLKSDNTRLRNEIKSFTNTEKSTINKNKEEIDVLLNKIKKYKTNRIELKNQISDLGATNNTLNEKIIELDEENSNLKKKSKNYIKQNEKLSEKIKQLEEESAQNKKNFKNVVKLSETISKLEEENLEIKKNNKKVFILIILITIDFSANYTIE